MIKQLITLLLLALLVFVVVLSLLYVFQRKLIYFPLSMPAEIELEAAVSQQLEAVRGADGDLLAWQTARGPSTKYRLVVFHGNGSLALFSTGYIEVAPPGWQVILAEYPGYGSRSGVPTEASIQESARELIELLQQDDLPIFLAGESLGAGVASWAAGAFAPRIAGVILVTPFTSLAAAAAVHYPWVPVRLLLRDRFESEAALREYRGPVTFIVADADTIVPARLGQELHDRYQGPKLLWMQPGADHNSVDFSRAGWAKIFHFLLQHDAR